MEDQAQYSKSSTTLGSPSISITSEVNPETIQQVLNENLYILLFGLLTVLNY